MAQGNEGDDNRNAVDSSHSLTVETTKTQRQRLATGPLTTPPMELPTLPFDLLPEILCRLPVKLLGQLRCLCKFFNSLVSDPNFAKKHLRMSTKRHHLMLPIVHDYVYDYDYDYDYELIMYDSPIPSLFSPSTVVTQTQLYIPNGHHCVELMCSCDGMICGKLDNGSYFMWNPSIRKFKLLPPLENHELINTLSLWYDHFIDNYKVVAVSSKKVVSVNTLGTDYWRRIEDIPYHNFLHGTGIFVCGTVNWISPVSGFSRDVIISLDLEKESYQNLCPPNFGNENYWWTLGVMRDCLCVFASSDIYWDVWIMKEYGNKESWTQLYTFPNLQDRGLQAYTVLYSSEDAQLLVECCELQTGHIKLVVYDPKTGTSNSPEFQNNDELTDPKVYIESLISP